MDPANMRFLFQGVSDEDRKGKKYGEISWRLGLLEPAAPAGKPKAASLDADFFIKPADVKRRLQPAPFTATATSSCAYASATTTMTSSP